MPIHPKKIKLANKGANKLANEFSDFENETIDHQSMKGRFTKKPVNNCQVVIEAVTVTLTEAVRGGYMWGEGVLGVYTPSSGTILRPFFICQFNILIYNGRN
jgi:hypothetical protein